MSSDFPWKAFFDEASNPRFILEVTRNATGVALRNVAINAAWETLTGIARETVIGRPPPDFLPQKFTSVAMAAAERSVETRCPVELEEEVAFPAGSRVWRTLLVPWPRESEPRFVLGFASDITEITRAQRALRDSESRYRRLAENAPDIVYRWRLQPELSLEYMSPAVERTYGYSVEEFYRDPGLSSRIVHPDDLGLFAQAPQSVLRGEPVVLRSFHRSGRIVWTESRNVPVFDDAGQMVAIEGISRDITQQKEQEEERRRLEQRLVETQKLESLGLLAGGIAHDFNNLLTGILGHASLLRSEAELASIAEPLLHIEQAARQAAELCKQLLAYSGKGRFSINQLDLSQLVLETSQLLELSLTGSAELSFDLPADLPPISADASQLRQVVMNLVINAAEALEAGPGKISIVARTVILDEVSLRGTSMALGVASGEFVMLEIADTGVGMSADTKARIFDPFFTTKFTGRGLGLSAVLGIVRGHGGAIDVESEPGKGTRFKLMFPVAVGAADRPSAPPSDRVNWRGAGNILVIDDEPAVRTVTARMLEALGFQPILVESGAEGIARFESDPNSITAVLLDLTMPKMDGDAVFREIRRVAASVPVLLMSGYSEQEATVRFTGRGLTGFVQKPFTMTELAQRLRATIEARRSRD